MTTATEFFSEIFNALATDAARSFWNGMNREGQNEFVVIAQGKSIEAAAREVEECAAAEAN